MAPQPFDHLRPGARVMRAVLTVVRLDIGKKIAAFERLQRAVSVMSVRSGVIETKPSPIAA